MTFNYVTDNNIANIYNDTWSSMNKFNVYNHNSILKMLTYNAHNAYAWNIQCLNWCPYFSYSIS